MHVVVAESDSQHMPQALMDYRTAVDIAALHKIAHNVLSEVRPSFQMSLKVWHK